MKILFAVLSCLSLGGCYQGYTLGGCKQETAKQHTVDDFGGIQWCAPTGARPRGFGLGSL